MSRVADEGGRGIGIWIFSFRGTGRMRFGEFVMGVMSLGLLRLFSPSFLRIGSDEAEESLVPGQHFELEVVAGPHLELGDGSTGPALNWKRVFLDSYSCWMVIREVEAMGFSEYCAAC